ncbi:MAG TPA: hypothetical protein VHW24_25780 [Bryobacteraceae bacterium]|nr:hypothetical protein [Bryobacteraceae bacterium]
MLRLTQTTVGPVSIAAGATATPPVVEAYNAGDGALSLSAQSSATWLTASIGSQASCKTTTAASSCFPINIQISASGLAASATPYTGIVTITSPNTVDAPQTITVTAAVGGTVPSSVTLYVAPGSKQSSTFTSNIMLGESIKTSDGAPWLHLLLDGSGSFRYVLPYDIQVTPQANQTSGTYTGTITTSGSSLPADNKTIAVTMQVTTQPIAQVTPAQYSATLAQGAPALTQGIALVNAGQGALTVSNVSSNIQGVTGSVSSGVALAKFDPGSLAPGSYTGSLTITSNAVNSPATVPVNFTVETKGAPSIPYSGVVDDAIFNAGDAVSPGDIVALFGDQLSFNAPALGSGSPLGTTIGTTQVLVNGAAAPLFYNSYGQINLQIPVNTATGTAQVQVVRDGQSSNIVSLPIASSAPRLLQIGVGAYGAILNTDGSIPMPTGSFPGVNTHPAAVGDTLTIYAIGMGATNTAIATGASASTADSLNSTPTVYFGQFAFQTAQPIYAGFSPASVGLYQVNVTIPAGVTGTVPVSVRFPDGTFSNPVQIAVK